MLRGGGRAFGPKPRDFATKLPRKVLEMAMRVALSAKVKERSLCVAESLQWPGAKTKDLSSRLSSLAWNDKVLFVSGRRPAQTLQRSSSNLQGVQCVEASQLTVYDVLVNRRIVLDVAAVKWLENRFGKGKGPLTVMPIIPLEVAVESREA